MDSAAAHLTAELLPRRHGPLRAAWSWAVALVGVATGFSDGAAPLDLVVRRRENGAEVMRTAADIGSPELLLAQVEADLLSKTVTEFFAEWRLDA